MPGRVRAAWRCGGPTFLFTRLSDVKPEMIAEATADARRAVGLPDRCFLRER